MDSSFLSQLNQFYFSLFANHYRLCSALNHRVFSLNTGYKERHAYFNENRDRVRDDFPLPFVEVTGFCYFQVEPGCYSCFTTINRASVSVLSMQEFALYPFDVWGQDDYYTLLFRAGEMTASLEDSLLETEETSFTVHFRLPDSLDEDSIYTFAKLLRKRGFCI